MGRLRVMVLSTLVLVLFHVFVDAGQNLKKTYIIHMDKSNMPADFDDHTQWYDSSLKSVSKSANIFYTYNSVIHGYSTQLTADEAKSLEQQPGILSVHEEVRYELHTTRSPSFMGLGGRESMSFFPQSEARSEVIIGVLDTGVYPESKSFDDTGLGPVPKSWKGTCQISEYFAASSCNRKLIGARFFSQGYEAALGAIDETTESKSPRDHEGHGTHTATTAAGSVVNGANLFGYAAGTARGMASHARVAAYKVCWAEGCFSSDILAGMDQAVIDGVNVLSLSLGGTISDYYKDVVAIGAFTAASKGIFVSCSAGNGGPSSGTLSNVAPWITTVGAGTMDREFPAYISIGNGKKLNGVSLYHGKVLSPLMPLVYAGNASQASNGNLCTSGSLIPEKVAGKIVVCDRGMNARAQKGLVVKDAGGIGMILANTDTYGEELVADAHFIPTAAVGQTAGNLIKQYIASNSNPTATFAFGGTKLGVQPSPVVAAFSSRGPNPITPDILKPDLIAPGVNILAAWTDKVGPTGLQKDTRFVGYNIISGTSMSCPHVSGLAALLKAAHPEWSPAAIRSALMTTSYSTYKNGKTIDDVATGMSSTPFDYGAGHVNPTAAVNPGLVYDLTVDDYINFLCALDYSTSMIKVIAKRDISCDENKEYRVADLNYPSFAIPLETAWGEYANSSAPTVTRYTRTLTNVGNPATYKASVSSETQEVKILVDPQTLTFSRKNEKKTYTVTFTASSKPSGTTIFARLEWSDGQHVVASPIAFSWT
ncbi:subtilisin-like protease SBT1.7 [Lycium ferocissimum]|uniref:subtilisin-like protease SBT1.7 n=1 Tax=Lycium ferocissimum TaxID=112874 RepID=UPI0028153372|nr:subtilisin-like protease SBT1.7 [Lycium ferocissimum]